MSMYDADDPRAALATAGGGQTQSAFGSSSYGRYYEAAPREDTPLAKNWYTRGQNFVVCYSEVEPGAVFERQGQVDEYVLLLHDPAMAATVEANGETVEVGGYTITMIPPGDSRITVHGSGHIVRLITTRSADVTALADNPQAYAGPHPQIPPFEQWPTPVGGFRIRSYSLDIPDQPGRFGKIFRCSTQGASQGCRRTGDSQLHSHCRLSRAGAHFPPHCWHQR